MSKISKVPQLCHHKLQLHQTKVLGIQSKRNQHWLMSIWLILREIVAPVSFQ